MTGAICNNCKQIFTDVVNMGIISNRNLCEHCYMRWQDIKKATHRRNAGKKAIKNEIQLLNKNVVGLKKKPKKPIKA